MDWICRHNETHFGQIDPAFDNAPYLHYSLIPAVLIVGLLSFLQKRTLVNVIDQRLPLLQGRFSIVIPMDTMGFNNRWSHGFVFGAISYSVWGLIYDPSKYIPFCPKGAIGISLLIGAFEVALAYFPFFACLSTPYKATGAVMGICYSLLWITAVGYDWFTCLDVEHWCHYKKLIYQWPRMLSLILLLGRFVFLLIKAMCKGFKTEQEDCEKLIDAHQIEHVKRLLRKAAAYSKPLNWFQRHVYEWDPHFKFPNRLIGTAIISVTALYMLTLREFWVVHCLFANQSNTTEKKILLMCHHVTIVTGSLNIVVYVCHLFVSYRKVIKKLRRGDKYFLPKKLRNPSSAFSVSSIARYSGWQISFTLWGYVIVRIAHLLVALLIYCGIILQLQRYGQEFVKSVGTVLLPCGIVLGLIMLQVFLAQYFFLQDKISQTDDQKPLALNNRNAFNCFNYFFLVNNMVMGVTHCLLRMILSFVMGTFLVSCIDRSIMPKGYERFDSAYNTWIGMIFADHYHNNPVLVCFCQLLFSHVKEAQHDYIVLHDYPTSQAKKRWVLFYTLLKNPQLIPLRKHHLSADVPLKLESSPPGAGLANAPKGNYGDGLRE